MQFSKRTALAVAGVATIAFAVPALAKPTAPRPNPGSGNHFPSTSASFICKDNVGDAVQVGEVDFTGPDTLWPPNHKFIDESSSATDSNNQQATLMLTVNPIDATGGDGGPTHDPDFNYTGATGPMATGTPTATVPYQLRAERSGTGDGRTYEVQWTATFDNGLQTCSWNDGKDNHAAFIVTVPHDMGNN